MRQTGFIALGPLLYGAIAAGGAILVLGGSTLYYKSDRDTIQTEFTAHKERVKLLGEKAESDKKLEELKNANKLADAVASRDDAIKQLQLDVTKARSRIRALPSNPTAPGGSRQVCFESGAYNAAFQRFGAGLNKFLQATSGYAFEGDSANLDAQTLIRSWPGAPPEPTGTTGLTFKPR